MAENGGSGKYSKVLNPKTSLVLKIAGMRILGGWLSFVLHNNISALQSQINLPDTKSELFYFFIIHINQHLLNIVVVIINHMTMTVWTLFTETMFSGETPLTLVSRRIVMQQMEHRGKTIYSSYLDISH